MHVNKHVRTCEGVRVFARECAPRADGGRPGGCQVRKVWTGSTRPRGWDSLPGAQEAVGCERAGVGAGGK